MGYLHRRTPTRRRGQDAAVDVENLTDLVVRRCKGCRPQVYYEVAERFLAAEPGKFGDDVQQQVLQQLQQRLEQDRRLAPASAGVPRGVNGAVLCSTCGRRYYDHPTDAKYPWMIVLCDGRKARVW